ncbi:hypothetical protein DH2020_033326 [Rehmannia glutinosa]|uniref:Uncharacterized protein n=1 Tax=Rehmannia glutinosa TaxID=99300 RepID=A0ABR0VG05_REHGL
MGNCIRKESSVQWGGEDWGSFGSDDKTRNRDREINCSGEVLSSGLPTGTEVKIKISKKQLEQLLKKADVPGVSVEQVLAQLMNDGGGGDRFEAHRRPWRPALQSIAE